MIDAEKLLGKVLAGALQGNVRKGRKNRRTSDSLVGSLLGSLASGKGLVTAIGLGIGAYEILKQNAGAAAPAVPGRERGGLAPPVIPSAFEGAGSAMPPPLPGASTASQATPAVAADHNQPGQQDLAVTLIRTMVAAAHADGRMDQEEERRILEKLQEEGLSRDERQFLLQELHAPHSIDELAAGAGSPIIAQTMYSLAVSAIVVDTPEERQWLDRLAVALSISPAMQQFIEQDAA